MSPTLKKDLNFEVSWPRLFSFGIFWFWGNSFNAGGQVGCVVPGVTGEILVFKSSPGAASLVVELR